MPPLSKYNSLPVPPAESPCGATVLVRLVDGLAFRYRWAVDGLERKDLEFRPCDDAMTLGQLLDHLRYLARWMHINARAAHLGLDPVAYPDCCVGLQDPEGDPEALIHQTMTALVDLRDYVLELGESGLSKVMLVGGREPTNFPVWYLLNGPLSDALTHVGQVTSWRRILGKPVPRHDVFRGRPPAGANATESA
jgi:hypothetical protein